MKKQRTAVLIMDIILGVLFLCSWGYKKTGEMRQTGGQWVETRQTEAPQTEVRQAELSQVELQHTESTVSEPGIKKIALTFDDGPHPYYTEQLLDGLKERGVCATFFVTGEHASMHPDVIERMQAEGHLIGNHTYSHLQLKKSNKEEFRQELILTNKVINEITGEEPQYVRPPYGSWDKSFEAELNMFPVLWTVDPLDWSSQNVSSITGKVVGHVKENDIILMHDYYETTVTAALQIVDELLAQGYTFVTVEDILLD